MSEEQQKPELEEVAAAAAESTTEIPAEGAPTVDAVQAEINSLTEQLNEAREQVLRAHAEAQNARRRAEQEVEKALKFGQEKLASDLLPVVDNLERALDSMGSCDETLKPLIEGVQLTLKGLVDTLVKHKIEPVNPLGEPFDPQMHQAMTMVDSPDAEPNSVINVFQKGYTLHGRLLRPAMVVVAK